MLDRNDHFDRLRRWLALESDAEQAEFAAALTDGDTVDERATLTDLIVAQEDAALGNRLRWTLRPRTDAAELPWTRLSAGTPVLVTVEDDPSLGWRATVIRLGRASLDVVFDTFVVAIDASATFRVDATFDEIGRRRQEDALDVAAGARGNRLATLRDVLLYQLPPVTERATVDAWFDATLNAAQQAAVTNAMTAADVALIHGPPGTGKTTTVAELIRQLVARGETVLACAPSNLGVDNIVEKLSGTGVRLVRLGHPTRVLPHLYDLTLEAQAAAHPDTQHARQLTRDAHQLFARADRWTRAQPAPGEKRQMRQEARAMLKDARALEAAVIERILSGAQVICSTTTGLDARVIGERRFDTVVIDEAAQATEPNAWIPITYGDRVVLAGDPYQLPPTILSPRAAAEGFAVSLMERLLRDIPESAVQLLEQFRMHEAIMGYSASAFYANTLVAAPAVRHHTLAGLPDVAANEWTQTPARYVDTAGAGYDETAAPPSRWNPAEATLALRHVQRLLDAGVAPEAVAIITPYAAQVRHVRERAAAEFAPEVVDRLEINSVDGFQGREKEAIVISLVRANAMGDIGFLGDTRRMNVALTRARRALIVIGDSATIAGHPFYAGMLDYFDRIGAYRSVWEEME